MVRVFVVLEVGIGEVFFLNGFFGVMVVKIESLIEYDEMMGKLI